MTHIKRWPVAKWRVGISSGGIVRAAFAALGHWIDPGVILAVVLANGIIGFVQEGKAEQAMNAIRRMLAPHANVMRGGKRVSVEGVRPVPGDIVLREAGDKVPADLRLAGAHAMSVQEAILAGESVPVEKQVQPTAQAAPLGGRSCMVFSAILVARGQGKGDDREPHGGRAHQRAARASGDLDNAARGPDGCVCKMADPADSAGRRSPAGVRRLPLAGRCAARLHAGASACAHPQSSETRSTGQFPASMREE